MTLLTYSSYISITKKNTDAHFDQELKINTPNCHNKIVSQLVRQNIDLFAEKDTDLGKTKTLEIRIETGNHPPIKLKPYRTPFAKRQIVSKAIDEMLKANIIQPSKSPWCFPVVVTKKDGRFRFCTDFRKLNQINKTFFLATASD